MASSGTPGTRGAGRDPAPSDAGEVHLREEAGGTIVTVAGALDLALAPLLRQAVERAARLRPELLVLDLSQLSFLASAGMAELVRAHRQRPTGTRMRVVATGRLVLRPLELTRLTDELDIRPTLAAALEDP